MLLKPVVGCHLSVVGCQLSVVNKEQQVNQQLESLFTNAL